MGRGIEGISEGERTRFSTTEGQDGELRSNGGLGIETFYTRAILRVRKEYH